MASVLALMRVFDSADYRHGVILACAAALCFVGLALYVWYAYCMHALEVITGDESETMSNGYAERRTGTLEYVAK